MKEYFIEVIVSAFPLEGYYFRVHNEHVGDALSPDLLMYFRVKALNKNDAVARALAGKAQTLIAPDAKALKLA